MNASMPFITGDYANIRRTLQLQIYDYGLIWVQHIDYIGQCTALGFNKVHTNLECAFRNAFICEMGNNTFALKQKQLSANLFIVGKIIIRY